MSYGTVNWIEVVWTLSALPGLIMWLVNRVIAGRSLRAVRRLGVGNGRMVVARYSVLKSNVLIGVQLAFVLIGFVSMLRPQNPEVAEWDWIRVLLTVGLLGAPAAISFLGYRWRAVDLEIVNIARRRLDAREADQNVREAGQNIREVEQNTRDDRLGG